MNASDAIAARLQTDERVESSTMMGFPCLRLDGSFVAMADATVDALIFKLPEQRVAELIDDGAGDPFAPSGKVFREWVSVPALESARWESLLDEAISYATG